MYIYTNATHQHITDKTSFFQSPTKPWCLVTQKQLKRLPISPSQNPPSLRPGWNDPDTFIPEEDLGDSSTALLVSISVSLVFLIIIVILLFCLLSRRNMAPCPTRSDFGRRYSQMYTNTSQRFR